LTRWRLTYDPKRGDRINVENAGAVDEFILMSKNSKNCVIHLEKMAPNQWWASVGDAYIWIQDSKSGPVVHITRGEYGAARGTTSFTDAKLGTVFVEHGGKR